MSRKKKKINLSLYRPLFDGSYMPLGTKIKRLEALLEIVENLLIEKVELQKVYDNLEQKLKKQEQEEVASLSPD